MADTMIETRGLTRRFGALLAVDRLDFRVPPGSVYSFLGPNGAGKTTTIRMLLGLIRPTAGEVHLLGRPLKTGRLQTLSRIGSLVETPSLYPNLTGRENLEVIRRLRNATEIQVARALAIVGLEKDAGRRVGCYSLGMRQRLGLALALLDQPELLLLDEPTNGLDPAGIREMRDLLRRLPAEYGVTVFISSHLLSEVEQMATHIGIIHGGKLIFQGPASDLHGRYHEQVALRVDRPELACGLLRTEGWQVHANGDGRLHVPANGDADAALLAQQLMTGGFQLYHVSVEKPSLEQIFLQLTTPMEA